MNVTSISEQLTSRRLPFALACLLQIFHSCDHGSRVISVQACQHLQELSLALKQSTSEAPELLLLTLNLGMLSDEF